jgi:hypothetical protein
MWGYDRRGNAFSHWQRWRSWALRSRLEPVIKVAPDGVDVVEVRALATAFELFDSLAGPERAIEQMIPAAQGIAARVLGW